MVLGVFWCILGVTPMSTLQMVLFGWIWEVFGGHLRWFWGAQVTHPLAWVILGVVLGVLWVILGQILGRFRWFLDLCWADLGWVWVFQGGLGAPL